MDKQGRVVAGIVLAVIIFAAGYLAGTQKNTPSSGGLLKSKETSPIKLGFIGPLTGDASSIGTVNKAAVELAVEEVNKAGGVDGRILEVIYEDGQCNAKAANNAANKLISVDNVTAIVGGLCSTETAAFAPAAMEKKTVVFAYGSSAPGLSKTGKYFFRSYPSDAFQGKFAAEYAYNTLKTRKVATLYHISEWGTGIKEVFEKRFKELGGEVISSDGVPQEARDYRTQLTKIKKQKIDLIYFPAYPDGSIVALKQAAELGITTRILGADAWADPKLQKSAKVKGEIFYTEPKVSLADTFKAKVLAKTKGDQVPIGTTNAYDNVMILAQALKKGTDGDTLSDAIRATQYKGESGDISFDANGDVTVAEYVVKRYKNGSAEEVK